MLNFVENYYEVTEENKELLRRQIIDEDILGYDGHKANVDFLVVDIDSLFNRKTN